MSEATDKLLDKIKDHYQFKSDEELEVLLGGLADDESKGVTYWDYIEVDTLLSLQKTKTNYPDEVAFIIYHQIHELYFKLIIQELEKITRPEKFKMNFLIEDETRRWKEGIKRIIRYFDKLTGSFDVLKHGLNTEEFKKFRCSLLPASGFQTHQFRLIEIMITSFEYLIKNEVRQKIESEINVDKHFDAIYWRSGAIDKDTGVPSKLLVNFNNKYDKLFLAQLGIYSNSNIYSRYLNSTEDFKKAVAEEMLALDKTILIWKVAHLITIRVHLPKDSKGTGQTNWKEYLPVVNQKICYFPELWKEKDINSEIGQACKDYPDKIMEDIRGIFIEKKI